MKTLIGLFALVILAATCSAAPRSRYLRHMPPPASAPAIPKVTAPLFSASVIPVSTALYITKAEYIATLKKKAANANLLAQFAGHTSGFGGPASERFYGKEEAYLDAMDYASFLRH